MDVTENRCPLCGRRPRHTPTSTPLQRQQAFARGHQIAAASHDPRVRARQARRAGVNPLALAEHLTTVEPVSDDELFRF